MDEANYDIAQVCLNGHVINSSARDFPQSNQDFCDECGARTIMACTHCSNPIRGIMHIPGYLGLPDYDAPAFCHKCGSPFPWTETGLKAAVELADTFTLSDTERADLKGAFADLVRDTPRTPVAQSKFTTVMKKVGREGGEAMRSVLVDIVSETVRKAIFGV